MKNICTMIVFLFGMVNSDCQHFTYPENNPVELGKVNWIRNFDKAVEKAEETGKPIFLLFQEVPGCGNCTTYGNDVLSHPLLVEAIEDLFVPLAIFNNKGGHDREILEHFGEPSWNNPVVRFVISNGGSIGRRITNFSSKAALAGAMVETLEKGEWEIPEYLKTLLLEFQSLENGTHEFYLSMYCFWTGEKEIAKIKGVVSTEAGFMHGYEVVKIEYDRSQIKDFQIAEMANKVQCADEIYSESPVNSHLPSKKTGLYRKDNQDKYYLRNSKYSKIPMTPYQKTRINSCLGSGKNTEYLLSTRQLAILMNTKISPPMTDREFNEAWYDLFQ